MLFSYQTYHKKNNPIPNSSSLGPGDSCLHSLTNINPWYQKDVFRHKILTHRQRLKTKILITEEVDLGHMAQYYFQQW